MNCYFTCQKSAKFFKTCLLRREKLHWPSFIWPTQYVAAISWSQHQ